MESLFQQHEVTIRLSSFLGIFLLVALWEYLAPRRALSVSRGLRWFNNISLVVLNTLLLRLLFPAAAAGVALYAGEHGIGLLNIIGPAFLPALVVSLVIMDFAIWFQHMLMHRVPLLWLLHRVHHADLDYDVTTGARFHPIEIILSMLIKFGVILLLGPPVIAVVLFEITLNGMAMFNHGNIRLPLAIDRVLRLFVVTPDMHRVHHSTIRAEHDTNYGFNLSCWDRLFGTYLGQPGLGHDGMKIGIREFRDIRDVSLLPGLLMLPFRGYKNQ